MYCNLPILLLLLDGFEIFTWETLTRVVSETEPRNPYAKLSEIPVNYHMEGKAWYYGGNWTTALDCVVVAGDKLI